MTCLQSYK